MNSKKTKIKDIANIEMYLKRIAYQIYEDKHEEDNSLIIVGVEKNGKILADKIFEILKNISTFDLTLMSIRINKKNPTNNISSSIDENKCLNKSYYNQRHTDRNLHQIKFVLLLRLIKKVLLDLERLQKPQLLCMNLVLIMIS
mgnify:CR=1 FL=1